MNQNKNIQFIKRWRDIERRQKDLDIEVARWCRDARDEFAEGSSGDHAFLNWLETEFGISAGVGEEMLARAAAARIVSDKPTWDRVGGFKNIRPLISLSKRDQVAVLETAKVECRAIRNVMRDRGLAPAIVSSKSDLLVLAEYVASLDKAGNRVPDEVLAIASRYVSPSRKRAA